MAPIVHRDRHPYIVVFRGLEFESDAKIEQKGVICKGLDMITTRIGKRGTVVIPARVRESYGLNEGSQVIVEPRSEGVLLRPVVTLPIEIYSAERRAEFLLNSAVTLEDYSRALKMVRKMGLDPTQIPHEKPID